MVYQFLFITLKSMLSLAFDLKTFCSILNSRIQESENSFYDVTNRLVCTQAYMYCVTMLAPTGRKPRGAVAMVFLRRNYTQSTRRYANRATLTQLGLAVYKPSQSLGGKHLCCVFQNSKNHEGRRMKIYKCFKNT